MPGQCVGQFRQRTDDKIRAGAEGIEEAAGAINPGGAHAGGAGPDDIEGIGGDQRLLSPLSLLCGSIPRPQHF
jgi:hypothetical protein